MLWAPKHRFMCFLINLSFNSCKKLKVELSNKIRIILFLKIAHVFTFNVSLSFFFKRVLLIYLFLDREEEREKERVSNINVWLPLAHPLLGTWPATQACAPTGNRTGDPGTQTPLIPLSSTSQA